MSLESWKKEFYPIPACLIAVDTDNPVTLIEHSLRKWRGALPENLARHELEYHHHGLTEIKEASESPVPSGPFGFISNSCSLCAKYYKSPRFSAPFSCATCPIAIVDGVSCEGRSLDPDSPGGGVAHDHEKDTYAKSRNDPQPMIALLERVLAAYSGNPALGKSNDTPASE